MAKKLLKGLALLGAVVLLLIAVLIGNTLRKGSRQLEAPPIAKAEVDAQGAAARLAEAVRLRTISVYDDPKANDDQFQALHRLLEQRFPKVHAHLKRERWDDLSLLYIWEGSQPALAPVVLLAHQDVVPIAPGTEDRWQQAPFSGAISDGFVWGRGAWDNKGNLMSQLEAVEALLASGYAPTRSVYLFMGADEELGGTRGAAKLAERLRSQNIKPALVLDEGLLITDGILKGLDRPAALIGVAEKGYLSVVMKFHATPGHSSQPPAHGETAIGMMSAALQRLGQHPMPAGLQGVAAEMFDVIAPEMQGVQRVVLSNLWLFKPLVQSQLERGAATQAMLRTTTAPTLAHAGNKDNVLPGVAEATVNFRLLPGDTREQVMAHVRHEVEQVAPSERFELNALRQGGEATPVSPTHVGTYRMINQTIREVFPNVIVAPGLMIAGTDSKHLSGLSEHIYKFSPVIARAEDLSRFHGTNERLSVENYADAIRFYRRLLQQVSSASDAQLQ